MAVGMVAPFAPSGNGVGVAMPASTASVSATLPASGESVLFFNSTASIAFVRTDAGPATPADTPIPAGGRLLMEAGPYVSAVSCVLASGSGTVYASPGAGSTY